MGDKADRVIASPRYSEPRYSETLQYHKYPVNDKHLYSMLKFYSYLTDANDPDLIEGNVISALSSIPYIVLNSVFVSAKYYNY